MPERAAARPAAKQAGLSAARLLFFAAPKKSNSPKAKAFEASATEHPSARRRARQQRWRILSRRGYFSLQPLKEK